MTYKFITDKEYTGYKSVHIYMPSVIISLLLAFFVYSTAYRVSVDYNVYKTYYEAIKYDDKILTEKIEVGFYYLCRMLIYFGVDVDGLYFLVCFFSILVKTIVMRRISGSNIPTLVYAIAIFPLHEYTQIRVAMAIGFCYLSVLFVSMYKPIFVFFGICGSMFHYSSIVPWCLIAVTEILPSRLRGVILFIFLLIISTFDFERINIYYMLPGTNLQNYAWRVDSVVVSLVNTQNIAFLGVMLLLLAAKLRLKNGVTSGYTGVLYVCVLALPVAYAFSTYPVMSYRLKEMLMAFWPLAIAYFYRSESSRTFRNIMTVAAIICSIVFIYTYYVNGLLNGLWII